MARTTKQLGCLAVLALLVAAAGCAPAREELASSGTGLAEGEALVGLAGKCLDVDGGASADGTKIQLWDCNGTKAQQWTLEDGALVAPSGKCLDVQWGGTASGTPVQLWTCNGSDAQKWRLERGALVTPDGKCLDVQWAGTANGTPIQIWDCNGSDAQKWTFGGGGSPDAPGTAPPVLPGTPAETGDLTAAQDFVKPLRLGINVERGWAWSMPGVDAAGSTTYWRYLKDTVGATHVRFFYPWRPTVVMGGGGANNAPPDKAQFGRILDATQQAIDAGLTVFLDCTDVMGVEDFSGDAGIATDAHIDNCATWTAERKFDPKKLALGPVNEWAGGDDNTTYNATRKKYHAVLRAKLPGYVLTTGPAYWKSRDYLYDPSKKFETFDDLRVVYEWHHYSSLDASGWANEEAKLAAWRDANGGRPTVCGEAGPGYWDEDVGGGRKLSRSPDAWPSRFAAQLPEIAAERPSIWAVTYGGEYRVNKPGDDPYILDGTDGEPNLLETFQQSAQAIQAKLGD